jgi:hypothetical protein
VKWEERILGEQQVSEYMGEAGGPEFLRRVASLVEQQKRTWPLLSEGYGALALVETRRMHIEGSEVVLQYNPKRIRSTAARVDKASVEARRCFLCPDSLPPEEKGIWFEDRLVILCNPYPICDGHLSIVHPEHVPQQIAGNVELLFDLAEALGPRYYVLYNGPEAGASAPDHLHFQACPRALLPVEEDFNSAARDLSERGPSERDSRAPLTRRVALERDGLELSSLEGFGRSVMVFKGASKSALARATYAAIDELRIETGKPEPMMNIICTSYPGRGRDGRVRTVYLFARARHRPSAYFEEGDRRLMISPGSIDMAGVVIVPEREHFLKITPDDMGRIFYEVSLDGGTVRKVLRRVAAKAVEEGAD